MRRKAPLALTWTSAVFHNQTSVSAFREARLQEAQCLIQAHCKAGAKKALEDDAEVSLELVGGLETLQGRAVREVYRE